MSCTDKKNEYESLLLRHAEQSIDSITRAKLLIHLKECPHCKTKLEEIQRFLTVISMIDKKVIGGKSKCLSPDEIFLYAEAPNVLPTDRYSGIKAHIDECFKCGSALKLLQNLNKSLQKPDFEKQYPIPLNVKGRLRRAMSDLVKTGASGNEPASIVIENEIAIVKSETCLSATGRELHRDQGKISIIENKIIGHIADLSGAPLRFGRVSLFRNGKPVFKLRADRFGGFHFENLIQGFYEIRAGAGGNAARMMIILKNGGRHVGR